MFDAAFSLWGCGHLARLDEEEARASRTRPPAPPGRPPSNAHSSSGLGASRPSATPIRNPDNHFEAFKIQNWRSFRLPASDGATHPDSGGFGNREKQTRLSRSDHPDAAPSRRTPRQRPGTRTKFPSPTSGGVCFSRLSTPEAGASRLPDFTGEATPRKDAMPPPGAEAMRRFSSGNVRPMFSEAVPRGLRRGASSLFG